MKGVVIILQPVNALIKNLHFNKSRINDTKKNVFRKHCKRKIKLVKLDDLDVTNI